MTGDKRSNSHCRIAGHVSVILLRIFDIMLHMSAICSIRIMLYKLSDVSYISCICMYECMCIYIYIYTYTYIS